MEEKKKKTKKSDVVKRTFKIDKDFVDPLLYDNSESFDDFEVEEIPQYHLIHLGYKLLEDE